MLKEAESLEASVREKKARKNLEDAEARAAAHQAEVESKMGEIQAMRTSHSHRLLEHRGATEKLEAEAAENLQEITKRYNDRLLNGTINRIMRQQIAAGWNKWVDSYRESKLAAGLSKHLEAHMKELETQQLAYASGLEKALAAHEVDKEKELRAKMRELDELSASRASDSEVMQRRITELEGTHADMVSELVGGHTDRLADYVDVDAFADHNPRLAGDADALRAALTLTTDGRREIDYQRVHRVLAEGNFVLCVSEGSLGGVHAALYDLFRVAGARLVEHWDTTEKIAPRGEWKNDNGKF